MSLCITQKLLTNGHRFFSSTVIRGKKIEEFVMVGGGLMKELQGLSVQIQKLPAKCWGHSHHPIERLAWYRVSWWYRWHWNRRKIVQIAIPKLQLSVLSHLVLSWTSPKSCFLHASRRTHPNIWFPFSLPYWYSSAKL